MVASEFYRRCLAEGLTKLEARELAGFAAGIKRERFFSQTAAEVEPGRAEALLARFLGGEPLAYIIGEWDFYGRTFRTDARTLIPRADTETLIDCAARIRPAAVADLCCGSGVLGITAALEWGARAVLFDVSPDALSLAGENIALLGASRLVKAVPADALLPPPEEYIGAFDAILCNPPYITAAELAELPRSVAAFEPRLALDGGADGLRFYRAVASLWRSALRRGGALIFEVGYTQAESVCEIARSAGFGGVAVLPDAAGAARCVACVAE